MAGCDTRSRHRHSHRHSHVQTGWDDEGRPERGGVRIETASIARTPLQTMTIVLLIVPGCQWTPQAGELRWAMRVIRPGT